MGVPTSEVGYTPAMPRREDHEVHKGHVVALGENICIYMFSAKHSKILFSHICTVHPAIIKVFNYQLIHKRIVFKGVLKFTLKVQQLQHVSV